MMNSALLKNLTVKIMWSNVLNNKACLSAGRKVPNEGKNLV